MSKNQNSNQIMSIDYLKELASDIMLDLTAEELLEVHEIEKEIKQKFVKVLRVDTDGIEPLNYPFEKPHALLRDDKIVETIPQSAVLQNAPAAQEEFVVLTKVIK